MPRLFGPIGEPVPTSFTVMSLMPRVARRIELSSTSTLISWRMSPNSFSIFAAAALISAAFTSTPTLALTLLNRRSSLSTACWTERSCNSVRISRWIGIRSGPPILWFDRRRRRYPRGVPRRLRPRRLVRAFRPPCRTSSSGLRPFWYSPHTELPRS